jgi:NAD(P)H dehydrogenase (quinone)
MRDTTIGVTGATGRLGGRITRRLAHAGTTQRLLVRDPARAPELPGATTARAAYEDTPNVRQSLQGLSTLLMVSASEDRDRISQHRAFVDAAAAAGVEHLVYISFYGAAPDATFTFARDHFHTEEHIRASGMGFTFLRDNIYADFAPLLVGPDDVIRGPAGDGRAAAVAQDDIADAAAAVLFEPSAHNGRTYSLTGPDALTLSDIAAILTTELGRPISYHAETVEEAYASRASYGAADWEVDGWVSTYTAIAAGELAGVTNDIPELTGHPATSLAEVVRRGATT